MIRVSVHTWADTECQCVDFACNSTLTFFRFARTHLRRWQSRIVCGFFCMWVRSTAFKSNLLIYISYTAVHEYLAWLCICRTAKRHPSTHFVNAFIYFFFYFFSLFASFARSFVWFFHFNTFGIFELFSFFFLLIFKKAFDVCWMSMSTLKISLRHRRKRINVVTVCKRDRARTRFTIFLFLLLLLIFVLLRFSITCAGLLTLVWVCVGRPCGQATRISKLTTRSTIRNIDDRMLITRARVTLKTFIHSPLHAPRSMHLPYAFFPHFNSFSFWTNHHQCEPRVPVHCTRWIHFFFFAFVEHLLFMRLFRVGGGVCACGVVETTAHWHTRSN